MSSTAAGYFWFVVIWLGLFVAAMLFYKIISKEKDKVVIFEVGYGLSASVMLLVDKFWLADGDLMTTVILVTFPLHLLIQFLIPLFEKPMNDSEGSKNNESDRIS